MVKFFKREKQKPENIEEILNNFSILNQKVSELSKELESVKKEMMFSVQKVGVVRFNPFSETGGDQSFSVAFLDGNNNGVVITSLYGREETRVYGKPVKEGESEYSLSKEEKEAIQQATNS